MYLLGVDFGGGASKATLLREDGVVTAVNTVEYRTIYPKQGYAEQNPSDWYSAIKENIMAVIKKAEYILRKLLRFPWTPPLTQQLYVIKILMFFARRFTGQIQEARTKCVI